MNEVTELNESVLDSIKKLLGITSDYGYFDADIIMYINAALQVFNQLAYDKTFFIKGSDERWSDYVGSEEDASMLKIYVYARVKAMFDNTQSSGSLDALNEVAKEMEFRLQVRFDNE